MSVRTDAGAAAAPSRGLLPDVGEVLSWSADELPRVRTLLALRRYWMRTLYPSLREAYLAEVAASGSPAPTTMDKAREVLHRCAGAGYFLWLDRYVQLRLWEELGRLVAARLDTHPDVLAPRPDDLGSLSLDAELPMPDYYTDEDIHRQPGGIWQGDDGALVYGMGARVIHVNSAQPYALHEGFVDQIDADPTRVLDLGAGFGKTTFFLKERWPTATVVAADLSGPVLRLGRRMATERGTAIDWVQANGESLPDPDATYDLVTVTMVLHELPADALARTLREVHRVLRPGGQLVALETRLTGDPLRDLLGAYHSEITGEPYINDFRDQEFAALARDAGFGEVDVAPWHVPGSPPPQGDQSSWATSWARLTARRTS